MERRSYISLILTHLALAGLLYVVIEIPKSRGGLASPAAFIAVILLIEGFYLFHYVRNVRNDGLKTGVNDITLFVWIILILWELWTSVSAAAHGADVIPEGRSFSFRSTSRLRKKRVTATSKPC